MDDEILGEFSDSAEVLGPDAIVYEMVNDGGGMGVNRAQTDTVAGRISTLSEVFLEWYLFDSSEQKDVKTFLATEDIQDVFTESDFMDLMCGGAYLDDDLLQYVSLKLPFYISTDKLRRMNVSVSANEQAYLVKSGKNIGDKIKEIAAQKQEQQRVHAKEYYEQNKDRLKKARHEYYLQNRERILEKNKHWVEEHPLLYRVRQVLWRQENDQAVKEYHKKYRTENAAAVSARKKKCYDAKKSQYQQHNRENYQKNKAKRLAHGKEYREELKRKAEVAQKICAAYVFLMILRKKNKEKYLELYTQQQNPLIGMLKTCAALQNMDMNMCPFCNHDSGIVACQCCNQKVLSIPNAIDEVQKLADALKQGKKPLSSIKTKRQKAQSKRLERSTYYQLHKDKAHQYDKMRRERDSESRKAVQKRSVEKNKEHYKEYKHAWYEAHKAQLLQQGKDRYQKNKAQIQQGNKARYEKNKDRYLAQRKVRAQELKEKTESAKKICAAYIFLMNLRKTNLEKYLELYTRQQKPLLGMLKTCAALQSMDINLCPFCNPNCGNKIEENCNLKALAVPGAIEQIQIIAGNLKQR